MEGSLLSLSGEYFYSVAAIFSCLAYLLRSILWLRILLACAAITYIVSGINLGITSMIGWNAAYLAINVFHITLLMMDKITINLPRETVRIYHRYFSTLSTREFKRLITSNGFSIFQDQNIIDQSDVPDRLYIVLRGKVEVIKNDEIIATLRAGDFIGEMSFLSKEPASANAYAYNLVQCAYWTHDDLERLKQKNLDAYDKFIAIIGRDLVRKLNYKNERQIDQTTQLDFVI